MPDENNPQNTQGVAINPANQDTVSSPLDQPGTIGASPPQPVEGPPLTEGAPTTASPSPTPLQQPGPVITTGDPKGGDKGKTKKVVVTILGIILLLAAVGAGVFLVGQQQEIREQAKVNIGAASLDVKAYNPNWVLLSSSELSALEPGDIVRFAVAGTTTSGGFDKARFTINGTLRPEVTAQKPASDEFYDEYTIPERVTDFTVSAEIHHTSLGWF